MLGIKKQTEPLLTANIKHLIPGRMRVEIRAIKYLHSYNKKIKEELLELPFIKDIKISNITYNFLVYFDKDKDSNFVLKNINDYLNSYTLFALKEEKKEKNSLVVKERDLHNESIRDILNNLSIMSFGLLYGLFRNKNNQITKSFIEKFTSIPSLTTLYVSKDLFQNGIKSIIRDKRPNADTLSSIAILASLLGGKDISALTVVFLHEIAELLTAYTMKHTRKAIEDMLDVGEDFLWKKEGDKIVKRPLEDIKAGDTIVVHTGEKLSIDGKIIKGNGLLDEGAITGEFLPKEKGIDAQVFAGTLNKNGTFEVEVEKVGDERAVSRIITMVQEANDHKATIQTYADKFSAALIPLNLLLATSVYFFTRNPTKALNMLIIDYSCGIRLSTATAFSASINNAARRGILIKGSNYLEVLAETDTLILDKTGTLTIGNPKVNKIICANFISQNELLALVGAAEEQSNHPLAHAILEKVNEEGIKIPNHSNVKVHIARGVETEILTDTIRVGNEKFMLENNIDFSPLEREYQKFTNYSSSIIYIARNNLLIGFLTVEDPLRDHMKKSINQLRNLGIDEMILLTGDTEAQAKYVAKEIGLDKYKFELLPEDKAKNILKLQSEGARVLMVGDGINDGPALAYADVGIALGSKRTDLAMEAAHITIASDNPLMLPQVIRLSKKTMKIIKENFASAIGINTLGLILGGAGYLPVFWGAVLHNTSTIMVVGNSLRLLFYDIERRN